MRREDDHTGEVAEDAEPVIHLRTPGLISSVFESSQEVLAEPAVALVRGRRRQRTAPAMPTIHVPAGQPSTPAVGCFGLPDCCAGPIRISTAITQSQRVGDAAGERRDAVEAAVVALRAVAERARE